MQNINELTRETTLKQELVESKTIHLFLLMMIDYIITYVGIHNYNFIQEGNPVLVWLFEIPFEYGVFVRILMSGIISFLFYVIYKSEHKHYGKLIAYAIIVNSVILVLHLRWILEFFAHIL
jgi:hypothetical protein